MPVGSTGYTVWDIKQQDFNFHAPLDMTNISVNYDTEWLLNYYKTGDIGSVFRENVRQALTGAEPGFSFNFFDKENETLRNAPVAADTYVLTNTGYQRVGDIVDESVTVWTGTQWATTRFTKTKSNVPTVTVTMTGGRTITCDPEHEFFVEEYSGRGSRRKLEDIYKVAAEDLEEGDIIHVSLPKEPSLVKRMSYRDYMLGYVYGDGSFNKSYPNRAEITYCTEESKGCASYIYKCKPDVQKFTVLNADGRGYTRHYLVDDIFKGRCKERLSYTDLDNVHIPSLIAGLFDADGNYDATQQRVRLSSVHLTFLQDVRRALETIGIESDVSKNGWCTYGDKQTYQLTIRKAYLDYFAAIIPTVRLNVPRGMTSYRPSMTKVISVTPNINQDVYCCDVKVPEHSFCAEGVIISNCTEVTSEDDSDVCNLGSINLGRIKDVQEFKDVVRLSTLFLICGTLRADLPYDKIKEVRAKNRRLGLGLMGMHEWLIQRGYRYEVTNELHQWLSVYKGESDRASKYYADLLYVSKPVANRAIAPTGSIGILAGTSTGIEPIFAVAYKRRYLKGGNRWHYQYVVDSAAQELISRYGIDPDDVESALDLAGDYERRIKFQADVQDYVDMSISSTINLPPRGDKLNNPDKDEDFAQTLAKYAHRLRGFTCYPDGSRGGQPLTSVPYKEAVDKLGEEFEEHVITHDICDISGSGGTCGV